MINKGITLKKKSCMVVLSEKMKIDEQQVIENFIKINNAAACFRYLSIDDLRDIYVLSVISSEEDIVFLLALYVASSKTFEVFYTREDIDVEDKNNNILKIQSIAGEIIRKNNGVNREKADLCNNVVVSEALTSIGANHDKIAADYRSKVYSKEST